MKFFKIQELIDRATYQKWNGRAWMFFNPNALEALDGLREFFNTPVIVNNWWDGEGNMQYRGYRPENCTVGAKFSEHKKGNAFDCTVTGYMAEDARRIILENQDNPLLRRIMRLEAKVSWVHFDCKEVKNRIYIFRA